MLLTEAERQRFESKIKRTDSCWQWTGSRAPNGYGLFWLRGRQASAHRLAYESYTGRTIPHDRQIDHLCRVRSCVNPMHLECVTVSENNRRGLSPLRNRSKTHCKSGHPFTPENTWLHKGARYCKECKRVRLRQFYARQKEQGNVAD